MALIDFNTADAPVDEFAPLPNGVYPVVIVDTELRRNSKDTGDVLMIKYEVQGDKCTGRFLFDFLNIKHENEVAQKIGLATLARICRALGIANIKDSDELLGNKLKLTVKVAFDKFRNEEVNKITKYEGIGNTPLLSPVDVESAAGNPPSTDFDDDIPFG